MARIGFVAYSCDNTGGESDVAAAAHPEARFAREA
jgi:hypothetical protein